MTGDWVVTIDADTRIDPRLLDATVPLYLMNGNLRLDWLSRNAVNGLWSGNGCVKLWPRALLQEMRSHEAAPPGAMSLDHDIGAIRPGRSAQVTMPERAAFTEPSLTAFHAFRAGLRETVFLRPMAEATALRSGRLQTLADRIAAAVGPFGHRVFTDSAPVLEAELAAAPRPIPHSVGCHAPDLSPHRARSGRHRRVTRRAASR